MTYTVFDAVTPLAQNIILQVQQLEPGKQILDEIADLHGARVVAQCDRVHSQARLLGVS